MRNKNQMPKLIRTSLIFEYIEKNRITRKEFCEKCGISVSTFYRIVKNKDVKVNAVFKIARIIKVPVHTLFKQ